MEANEIQRLACMANALRPEWPSRSMLTFIGKHFENRAYGDVAVALAWVATRTKTETPRLLLEAGPWWKAAATEAAHVQRPPRKDEECKIHAGQWSNACHGCAADRLTGERTLPANLKRPDVSQHLALARAELAQTRANLCPHGVDLKRARCADCETAAKKPAEQHQPETEESSDE